MKKPMTPLEYLLAEGMSKEQAEKFLNPERKQTKELKQITNNQCRPIVAIAMCGGWFLHACLALVEVDGITEAKWLTAWTSYCHERPKYAGVEIIKWARTVDEIPGGRELISQ